MELFIDGSATPGGLGTAAQSCPLVATPNGRSPACRVTAARLILVTIAGIAQLVEHNLAKVGVAGSSPVSRS